MLHALTPLDRTGLLVELDRQVALGESERAIDRLGANPLAVLSWVATDGVLAGLLDGDERRGKAFAGIAVLFARWRRERFVPKGPREELARACFDLQLEFLAGAFARLRERDSARVAAARRAHRAMSRAAMLRDAGSLASASEAFAEATDAWREAQEPYFEAQVAADHAAVLEGLGELEDAASALDLAVRVAQETGDLERLGRRRLHRGKVFLQLERADLARADYREAQGVFHVTGEHAALALALLAEGEAALVAGDDAGALAPLEAARAAAGRLGDHDLGAQAERLLAALAATGAP